MTFNLYDPISHSILAEQDTAKKKYSFMGSFAFIHSSLALLNALPLDKNLE